MRERGFMFWYHSRPLDLSQFWRISEFINISAKAYSDGLASDFGRTCCLGVSASGYYHFVLCKRRSNTRNILDMVKAFNLPICSFRFKLGMDQYSFQYHDYFSGLVQKR
ncbi:uncharacterized protein LOC124662789 [Lolium rigidum]|uniref:uncharacterized protein LOC124662789 n=1 Tax=Lolium rigidum TaxID=89674 RepID=UPI001F5E2A58|nr:uncharacterized protein LOC124662789 [Lolium rigidum]